MLSLTEGHGRVGFEHLTMQNAQFFKNNLRDIALESGALNRVEGFSMGVNQLADYLNKIYASAVEVLNLENVDVRLHMQAQSPNATIRLPTPEDTYYRLSLSRKVLDELLTALKDCLESRQISAPQIHHLIEAILRVHLALVHELYHVAQLEQNGEEARYLEKVKQYIGREITDKMRQDYRENLAEIAAVRYSITNAHEQVSQLSELLSSIFKFSSEAVAYIHTHASSYLEDEDRFNEERTAA